MPDKLDVLRLCLVESGLDPDRCAVVRHGGQIPTRPFRLIETGDMMTDVFGAAEAAKLDLVEYTD